MNNIWLLTRSVKETIIGVLYAGALCYGWNIVFISTMQDQAYPGLIGEAIKLVGSHSRFPALI